MILDINMIQHRRWITNHKNVYDFKLEQTAGGESADERINASTRKETEEEYSA